MKSLLDVLKLSTDYLNDKGIQYPRREAQDLICDALNIKRMQLYLEHDRPLIEPELQMLRERIMRRAKGEPAAYIHGKVTFLNCVLKVTPAVLIPRQETEILTDKIIRSLEKEDLTGKSLWDLCCGSGCIGIAIKKKFPQLKVILSDISSKALAIAQENAEQNEVEVTFLEGDLLNPFKEEKTHFAVCNPPYISRQDFTRLEAEVQHYEPREALIGGDSGLEFYQRLAERLEYYLLSGGKAWFEIGEGQGELVESLFRKKPWKTCKHELDWSNKDRFFFLEIE